MTDSEIWKSILEAVNLPIFVIDVHRTIVFANQTVIDLVRRVGFLEDDRITIGRNLFETIPKLPQQIDARYETLFRDGLPQEDQREFHIGETTVWLRSNRYPVMSGGRVTHIATMLTDETQLRGGEVALRRSEETARAIINSSNESIILIDRNGTVLSLNDVAAKRLGKLPEELIGKTGADILPPHVWNLREPQLEEVIRTGRPKAVRDTRNGRVYDFTMNPVLDSHGAVSQISIFAADVTARVREQEELIRIRQAVESSSDAIAMTNAEGRHVFSNRAFESLFGWTVEQLDSAGGPSVAYRDPAVAAHMFATIKAGTPWSGIVEMITRDNRELLIDLRADAIYDSDQRLVGLIGIHTDVTREQLASEQLRKSEEKCRLQFQSIPVPTFIWEKIGEDFQLKDYNLAARDQTKGGIAQFIGKRASEMYINRTDIIDDLTRCFKTKSPIMREMNYRYHTVPEERFLKVSYVPIPPNLILVHTVDLTERKQIETELTDARHSLESVVIERTTELQKQIEFDFLVQQLLTSFASCSAEDIDEKINEALQALATFIGTDNAYMVIVSPSGDTYTAIYSWTHGSLPDHMPLYQDVPIGQLPYLEKKVKAAEPIIVRTMDDFPPEAIADRAMLEGEGVRSILVVPLRGRGGKVGGGLGLRSYTRTVDWNEEHVRWLRTIGDAISNVLERRHSESARRMEQEKAELYLQTAEVILVALDIEGLITRINRKGCQILGYEEQELVGQNWFEMCILPEDVELVWQVAKDLYAGVNIEIDRFENHVRTKNGERRLVAWHNSLLRDKSGEVIGCLSSGEDITDRKRAESERDAAYERLKSDQLALEQKNIALLEMIQQIQESKKVTAGQIQTNLDRIVLPVLERIGQRLDPQGKQSLSMVRESLSDIVSPFVSSLESHFKRLSPREIEICELIRRGYDSKQIADLRNSSVQTVLKQRKSIRKKLGLDQKKINLATYLSGSFPEQRKHGKKKNSFDN